MYAPKGSYYLDRATVERAVSEVMPFVVQAMKFPGVGDSGFLHVVVMDPALRPGDVPFEDAVLHECSIGDRIAWDADYQVFARAKAKITWSTGLNCHLVQALRPHALREGDTTLWGSTSIDGIVVAVSGANPWYDEAFAAMLGSWLKAKAYARAHAHAGNLFLTPPAIVDVPAIA